MPTPEIVEDGAGERTHDKDDTVPVLSPTDTGAPTFDPQNLATVQAVLEHEARKNKQCRAETRDIYAMLKALTESSKSQGGVGDASGSESGGGSGSGKGPGPFKRSNTTINKAGLAGRG